MLIRAHVLDGLASLPDDSVHCVVTSPPYYGLRDYGLPPSKWGDGWEGCLGLEPTPEQYVAHLVEVFAEVRRVLRADGTLWLNLGDSYAGSTMTGGTGSKEGSAKRKGRMFRSCSTPAPGLKPKDLIGTPWRVAFALQADGWWLRRDIVWAKPNPMPESVTDRPTTAHEFLFLLSPSARYFYDAHAVREPNVINPEWNYGSENYRQDPTRKREDDLVQYTKGEKGWSGLAPSGPHGSGRNLRSVWTIPTAPFPEAHFATFPPALVEPCIKAGTSERGVCPECGAPWERVVRSGQGDAYKKGVRNVGGRTDGFTTMGGGAAEWASYRPPRTTGWRPTCDHEAEPVPATALDPFSGAATVGVVCAQLGRRFIGLELSAEYVAMARRRLMDYDLEAAQRAATQTRAATITGPLFEKEPPCAS